MELLKLCPSGNYKGNAKENTRSTGLERLYLHPDFPRERWTERCRAKPILRREAVYRRGWRVWRPFLKPCATRSDEAATVKHTMRTRRWNANPDVPSSTSPCIDTLWDDFGVGNESKSLCYAFRLFFSTFCFSLWLYAELTWSPKTCPYSQIQTASSFIILFGFSAQFYKSATPTDFVSVLTP